MEWENREKTAEKLKTRVNQVKNLSRTSEKK